MALHFEVVTANLLDLPASTIARLREMTLSRTEATSSYMRDTLDEHSVLPRVKVALAQIYEGWEIGWSMIRPYSWDSRLIQVFVKPEFRRHSVGTKLFQALNNGTDVTAIAWNDHSRKFFQSLHEKYEVKYRVNYPVLG